MPRSSWLYVNELSKSYGNVVALAPCSFSLEKGEILGLLGESGSGKTTLLRLLGGFEMPRSGSMSLNATLMNDRGLFMSPEKRKIGIVFQDYALFPHLTVAQNIAFGLQAPNSVRELLQVVGLDGYQDRKPDEISGGQQQRVAIARALAADPDLLLLDEPFSNIDESMKFSFRRELRDILKKAGTTAIFVTHDTRDALDLGDKVMVIQNGHQVQVGKPEDIYLRPASAYVAQLLGPINHIDTSRCIRAEHVQVQQSSQSHAEVVRSVFQGSVYHVHVRTDEGSNWIASSREDWQADTRVELQYDQKNILTFPA